MGWVGREKRAQGQNERKGKKTSESSECVGGTSPYLAFDFFSKKGMFRRPEGDFLRSCGKKIVE